MRLPIPWGRAPLFLRVFLMMVVAVATVQVISGLLLLILPPPAPRFATVQQVASLLQGGKPTGELRVTITKEAPPDNGHPKGRAARLRLAEALAVPESQVAVHARGGPQLRFWGVSYAPPLVRRIDPARRDRAMHESLLFGSFEAGLRLPDGRWRVVSPVRDDMAFWRWRAISWLLATLLAMIPLAWWLSQRVARPIALFAQAADRLGRDPHAPPLEVSGPPELAEAAATFNEMQARLARYLHDRSTMMAAVAHDLRTPLMRLSLRLDGAPAPLREAAAEDVREMNEMIGAVLAFLRNISTPPRRQRLDLRSLAESVTDGFADRGADVRIADGPPVIVEGDPTGLKSAVSNLVGNAIAYAGNAAVSLGAEPGMCWLEVRDEGPGIPEDELERVFEPFYRLEQSRSRETGGTGLGLASARAIIRAHGGDVTLANAPGGGLVARLTIPA